MAALPARNGKDTPEYKAMKEKSNQIAKLCQYSLTVLASELFSKDMLTGTESSTAMNQNQPAFNRAVEVLAIVRNLVERNTSYFGKFVSALRESDLTQAADELEASVRQTVPTATASSTTTAGPGQTNTRHNLDEVLSIDDLFEVYEVVFEARNKWYDIGLGLKLKVGTLDTIEAQHGDIDKKCKDMVKNWLTTGTNRTWRALAEVLGKPIVGRNDLKEKILPA